MWKIHVMHDHVFFSFIKDIIGAIDKIYKGHVDYKIALFWYYFPDFNNYVLFLVYTVIMLNDASIILDIAHFILILTSYSSYVREFFAFRKKVCFYKIHKCLGKEEDKRENCQHLGSVNERCWGIL